MIVTPRATIEKVSFRSGEVEIHVVTHLIDETGRVVGSEAMRMIRAKEPAGDWGNKAIEQLLLEQQEIVQQPAPAMPAVDAVVDAQVYELRPALAAIPARDAVWKKMFPDNTTFAWA
jgi:hypothetical protein